MATATDMKRGRRKGILVATMTFGDQRFSRVDLVFTGVDHSAESYEVLVFLNNPSATDTSAHELGEGYGGRFIIFGHGNCFGDAGHCEVPTNREPDDLRPPHPLTPTTKIVTITDALRAVLNREPHQLNTVTLVPIAMTPRRKDRHVTADLFRFGEMTLRSYLGGTDTEVPTTEQVELARQANMLDAELSERAAARGKAMRAASKSAQKRGSRTSS